MRASVHVHVCSPLCKHNRAMSQEEAVEAELPHDPDLQVAAEMGDADPHVQDTWEDAWDMGDEDSYPPAGDSKIQFAIDYFDAGCSWTIHSTH